MKPAAAWFSELPQDAQFGDRSAISVAKIREIQADALQFAYDELAKERALMAAGVIHGALTALLSDADPSQHDPKTCPVCEGTPNPT